MLFRWSDRVLGQIGLDARAFWWKINWQHRYSPARNPTAFHSSPNLVNESFWELWVSDRDSNFFHLCRNVAFKCPVSQHQLFAVCFDHFPCGEGWAKEGNDLEKANGNTRRLPRLHPFSPETIQNDAMGLLLGFTDRKTTGTHTHRPSQRVQACGRDAPW